MRPVVLLSLAFLSGTLLRQGSDVGWMVAGFAAVLAWVWGAKKGREWRSTVVWGAAGLLAGFLLGNNRANCPRIDSKTGAGRGRVVSFVERTKEGSKFVLEVEGGEKYWVRVDNQSWATVHPEVDSTLVSCQDKEKNSASSRPHSTGIKGGPSPSLRGRDPNTPGGAIAQSHIEALRVSVPLPQAGLASNSRQRVSSPVSSNPQSGFIDSSEMTRRRAEGELAPGDEVLVWGRWEGIPKALNPHEFDYRGYATARGIVGWVRADGVIRVGAERGWWTEPMRWLARVRRQVEEQIERSSVSDDGKGVMLALLLGEQGMVSEGLRTVYSGAGVAHLLAVSGLHLGCLAGFVLLVSRVLLLVPGTGDRPWVLRLRYVLSWAAALGFLALTGAPTSCARAFLMWTGFVVSRCSGRDYDVWTWLGASGLAVLSWRPEAVFEAGFQLSTLSVAGIALAARDREWLRCVRERVDAGTTGWWFRRNGKNRVRRGRGIRGKWRVRLMSVAALGVKRGALCILASARVTAAATAATAPVIWWHFGIVPVTSIPSNLVAVPIYSLCVLPAGLISVAAGWGIPALAEVGWRVAGAGMWAADLVVKQLLDWVGAPAPAWPGLFLACAVSWGILGVLSLKSRKLKLTSVAVVAAAAAGCALLPGRSTETRVFVFHVGDGDATLIRARDGMTLLVDGGRKGTGHRVLLPWFRKQGVKRIDQFIMSHGHEDHWGGLEEIAPQMEICRIAVNGSKESYNASARIANKARKCDGKPTKIERVHRGYRLRTNEIVADVLWPPLLLPASVSENDRSLVLRVRMEGVEIWFTGDIESPETVESLPPPSGEVVLKAPHHGRALTTLDRLVQRLRPRLVIVTADEWKEKGVETAGGKERDFDLWVTGSNGALELRLRHGQIFSTVFSRPFSDPTVDVLGCNQLE